MHVKHESISPIRGRPISKDLFTQTGVARLTSSLQIQHFHERRWAINVPDHYIQLGFGISDSSNAWYYYLRQIMIHVNNSMYHEL